MIHMGGPEVEMGSNMTNEAARSVKQLRVLVCGRPDYAARIDEWLDQTAQVTEVDSVEEALRRLRGESFDLVVSRANDFIPLQGYYSSGQAAAIIDSVSQGVCIIRETGHFDWANPTMLAFSDEVREKVKQFCVQTSSWAQAQAGSKNIRGRRFSFTTASNDKFEVTATPVVDQHNRITQVAAVVWDVTSTHRLQEQIDAIDRAGRELLSLDSEQVSRLEPQERLALLEQKIVRCTQELLHFENFEIRVLDKATNRLEPVLSAGMPTHRPPAELFAESQGQGICGFVAARGESYICSNVPEDPLYVPGIEGARSSLTVPLTLHDEVVGVANFESAKQAAFSEDDRQFAEIFGRYVALALHILDLLVFERQTATGKFGSNVLAEITGPVNDILTEVDSMLDACPDRALRDKLQAIGRNASRIRETINDMTATKPGLIGAHYPAATRHDPNLSGRRILLADDEEIIRDTVRDVLTGYGCEVHVASDGGAAIDLISKQQYDLVLSDIKMPIKSGYEVFAAAKAADPRTPVILTTGFGYDPNHSIIRARREGLAAVLFKPFKVDQLLGEVRTALQAAAAASN